MNRTSSPFHVSHIRRRKIVWILLVSFICSFMPVTGQAQQPTATISALNGTVLVNGQEQGEGTVLGAGDILETQAGASVELELSDGSVITLGENTKLDITALSQTVSGARVSRLELLRGWLRAKLSPGHQKAGSGFTIDTPNAQVGVKFSQPDVEVSYDPTKQETVGIAHTVQLLAKNLLTDEEVLVPVGSSVIIVGTTIKIVAGILTLVGASEAGTAAATETATAGATETASTSGLGTGTKVAIGVGATAAVGGVVAVATGSDTDNKGAEENEQLPETRENLSGTWYFSGSGFIQGCVDGDICLSYMFPKVPIGQEGDFIRNGPFTFSDSAITVSQIDSTLSGSWTGGGGQFSASLNGTVNDSIVSFTIEGIDYYGSRGTMTTNYTGSLDGNTINGTFEGSGFWENPGTGSGTWTWSGNVEITIN